MVISSIPTATLPAPGTNSAASGTELGKDQFFQLLVAQLQHQDPLAPQDNSQFIAQLAQFSSLEQLQSLGSQMSTLNLLATSLNNAQSVDLVGRDVVFQTSELQLEQGTAPPALEAELPAGAGSGSLNIHDSTGTIVRTLSVPAGEGRQSIAWDGKDAQGNALPPGSYHLEVSAAQPDGSPASGVVYLQGTVDRARFSGGQVQLEVAGQTVPLDQIVEIATSTPASPSTSAKALRAFSASRLG